MQTYTPPGGYSQPNQNLQGFQQALAAAQGPATTPEQQIGNNAQAQAMTMQANQPQFIAQQKTALSQQAGLPQMAGNYADEAKMQQLFAHDQNLSKQFTRPDMQVMGAQTQNQGAPTAGSVGAPQAPVLTQQGLDQGFQGFATPQAQNAGIQLGGNQIQGNLDLINKALQYQASQVQNQVGSSGDAYNATIKGLLDLAGLAKDKQKSGLNAGDVFDKIINQVQGEKGGQATQADVWNYINQHDAALRDQGVDVNELWNLHQDLKRKVGDAGIIGGSKMPKAPAPILDKNHKVTAYKLPDGNVAQVHFPAIWDIGAHPTVHVKDRTTGQTGSLPIDELDMQQYEVIP